MNVARMSLEALVAESMEGLPSGFGDTVRKAIAALKAARLKFAVAGAVAFGKRIQPRNTTDLDVLVEPERWKDAIQAARRAGFVLAKGEREDEFLTHMVDPKTGVGLDLMFGVGDPEESARETAPVMSLFKTRAPVVNEEYMLWMYAVSDQPRHHDRAIEMIRRGEVNVARVRAALRRARDQDALRQLAWFEGRARLSPEREWRRKQIEKAAQRRR